MRNRNLLSLIIIALYTLHCYAQDTLYYSQIEKLEPVHFASKMIDPDLEVHDTAKVYAYITTDMYIHQGFGKNDAFIKVRAAILPNESWLNKEYRYDKNVLSHEWYHFKITEIFARKFRRYLILSDIDSILKNSDGYFEDLRNKCIDYQRTYDIETEFSTNLKVQRLWEHDIDKQLKSLEDYS